MKQKFAVEPTPSVARRLLKLHDAMPGLVMDPSVYELAKTGEINPTDLAELKTENEKSLVQELLDHDLRAIVGMPGHWQMSDVLTATLTAVKLSGIADVVFDTSNTSLKKQATKMGFVAHVHDPSDILPELTEIPRSAVFIITEGNDSDLSPGLLEFEKTILFCNARSAHRVQLYPAAPTLNALFMLPTDALRTRGMSKVNPAALAFLTSVILYGDGKRDMESRPDIG